MFDLSKIENNKKVSILLRHSEREPIPKGEIGDDVNITLKGIEMAKKFGKELQKFEIKKIYSSPVKRCVQTSEKIAEGYCNEIEIIETQILGSPSAYIFDVEKATEHFMKSSLYENYLALCNKEKLPGFYSLEEGSIKLENFVKQNSDEKNVTLFISHDITILYYIYFKTKKLYNRENWLDFLDGIKIEL